jgi:hypothetical protein
MINIKKPETILIFLIIIIGGIILYNVIIFIPSQKFSLDVDAIRDPESLFVNSRVVLKNTGLNPLNNITIIYDDNMKFETKVDKLNAGETVILSPPEGTPLKSIHIISKEGIDLNKSFRSPTKLPGMIGS